MSRGWQLFLFSGAQQQGKGQQAQTETSEYEVKDFYFEGEQHWNRLPRKGGLSSGDNQNPPGPNSVQPCTGEPA